MTSWKLGDLGLSWQGYVISGGGLRGRKAASELGRRAWLTILLLFRDLSEEDTL